ncbi:uncharacterized protein LOC113301215 isoform X2 [Papaver somniferum]|uniref:uncharacterized protein LOC113301215 isoform X2 n=1 Tax=Papaver somniferum TaxID=3469 RepID=UPI000E704478|nr:uncharacterized protein LOC113301215 isoform X2 [Papaver somniferum]
MIPKKRVMLLREYQKEKFSYQILRLISSWIMARDLLTPPASTVASESCFSLSGRILSKKRSRLAPDILDALVCSKDWNDARKRRQEFNDEYEEVSQGSMVKLSPEGDSTFLTWISQSHESLQILFVLLISYAWNVQLCKAIFWMQLVCKAIFWMYIYQMFSLTP